MIHASIKAGKGYLKTLPDETQTKLILLIHCRYLGHKITAKLKYLISILSDRKDH